MEVHYRNQSEVQAAGGAVLSEIKHNISEREPCKIVWKELICAVSADHATLINRQLRMGSMMIPGKSMFILETEPAGYIVYAANEAEKGAHVTLVDMKAFGPFGRLIMMGTEAEAQQAMYAAENAIAKLNQQAGA